MSDPVNHPSHYTRHPSGVECIQVAEHLNFCRGNAIKYIWRAGEKGDAVEDLRKAVWYLEREIARLAPPLKTCRKCGGCGSEQIQSGPFFLQCLACLGTGKES